MDRTSNNHRNAINRAKVKQYLNIGAAIMLLLIDSSFANQQNKMPVELNIGYKINPLPNRT